MTLYPAIDLYGQKVVRLDKGDYDKMTEYGNDPAEWGLFFRDCGAAWLHVVDLEGARSGRPMHLEVLRNLVKIGLRVQFGGGLRNAENIREVLEAGASRILLGSLLLESGETPGKLFTQFGDVIAPAVDVRAGRVAVKGWTSLSGAHAGDFTGRLAAEGFTTFLFTSIEHDGTLMGPDIPLYAGLRSAFPAIRILAAGGISSMEDLHALRQAGADGAVLGKSLYEGRIDLCEALEAFENADETHHPLP